jgi:hypothetical protein
VSDIDDFVLSALEASVFVSPRNHGLAAEEVVEIGQRLSFQPGELQDAIARFQRRMPRGLGARLRLHETTPTRLSADFGSQQTPDFRDVKAFDFVRTELIALAKQIGESAAQLSRDVLVERGFARGLDRHAVEVAITISLLEGILQDKDGAIGHAPGRLAWALPSIQHDGSAHETPFHRMWLQKAHPVVRDVIARRSDGRAPAANPLDAFESMLGELGHDRFRAWWVQKRDELKRSDSNQQPVAVTVLAAALAEAALTFVVPRAKAAGLMKRLEAEKPRTWKFADLVSGAKSGDPTTRAILDERTAARCLELNEARQRIHAGFLIDEVPTGPIPDLKPEQARDALQTVDQLVRKVFEWLVEAK